MFGRFLKLLLRSVKRSTSRRPAPGRKASRSQSAAGRPNPGQSGRSWRPAPPAKRPAQGGGAPDPQGRKIIAYHGTPSVENARSILRHGFLVGHGNAYGDGVYFASDVATAKSYAGTAGVYLRCLLEARRPCQWTTALQGQYQQWCRTRGVSPDNSAMTAFLLQQGFDLLRANNIVVALRPQMANAAAWKQKDRRIRILGIHRASDDRPVRV